MHYVVRCALCDDAMQISAIKVYLKRNSLQVELIRCRKNCLVYSRLLLRSDGFNATERKSGNVEHKPLWLRFCQSTLTASFFCDTQTVRDDFQPSNFSGFGSLLWLVLGLGSVWCQGKVVIMVRVGYMVRIHTTQHLNPDH